MDNGFVESVSGLEDSFQNRDHGALEHQIRRHKQRIGHKEGPVTQVPSRDDSADKRNQIGKEGQDRFQKRQRPVVYLVDQKHCYDTVDKCQDRHGKLTAPVFFFQIGLHGQQRQHDKRNQSCEPFKNKDQISHTVLPF